MATKSILKTINVRGREQVSRLADAMEKAEAWQGKEVRLRYPVVELRGEQIREFADSYFEGKAGRKA